MERSEMISSCKDCGRLMLFAAPDSLCSICEIHRIEDKVFVQHVEWALATIQVETIAKGLGLSGKSFTLY